MRTKRYQAYKDSGVTWLGKVPKHWEVSRIKNLGILSRGVDLPRDDFVEGIYPVYGSNGIIGYHSNYTTKAPCVTVGRSGSVGEVNYVVENFWAHNTALYLQKSFGNSIKFIFYLFKSLNLQSLSAGSAVGTLNRNIIHQLKITIPPLSEQESIAAYLDTKTAQIDRKIDLLTQKANSYAELKRSLINETVTLGIDRSAPMKNSEYEWDSKIPKFWQETRVKNIFKLVTDLAPNDNDFELLSLYASIGVRPRKDMEQRGNKSITTDGYWMVKKGDIVVNKLLAWMGAIGLSEYDGVTSPAYDILRKSSNEVDQRFYTYLFRTEKAQSIFKKHSRGIMDVRLRLYFDKFGAISVPFPPLSEQKAIADYLDTKTAQIDQIIQTINTQIEKLKELRKTLINDAVTGKIKVTDDDESAHS